MDGSRWVATSCDPPSQPVRGDPAQNTRRLLHLPWSFPACLLHRACVEGHGHLVAPERSRSHEWVVVS